MKKAVSLVLTLAMCLSLTVPALADMSTTTSGTAYKDLEPRTEIYAVTKTPGSDYPQYNMKHEPKSGVLYGRTAAAGNRSDGRYGITNLDHMAAAGESVVSYYYGLSNDYTLEYWS